MLLRLGVKCREQFPWMKIDSATPKIVHRLKPDYLSEISDTKQNSAVISLFWNEASDIVEA